MHRSTEHIVNANIQRIYTAPGQSLLRWNFVDEDGGFLREPDGLIQLMEEEHLIEHESDPDLFFLTEHGYNTVEKGGWGDLSQRKIPPDGSQRLTLNNLGEAMEKSGKGRKKIYGLIWTLVFAFAAFSTLYYVMNKDDIRNLPEIKINKQSKPFAPPEYEKQQNTTKPKPDSVSVRTQDSLLGTGDE